MDKPNTPTRDPIAEVDGILRLYRAGTPAHLLRVYHIEYGYLGDIGFDFSPRYDCTWHTNPAFGPGQRPSRDGFTDRDEAARALFNA